MTRYIPGKIYHLVYKATKSDDKYIIFTGDEQYAPRVGDYTGREDLWVAYVHVDKPEEIQAITPEILEEQYYVNML